MAQRYLHIQIQNILHLPNQLFFVVVVVLVLGIAIHSHFIRQNGTGGRQEEQARDIEAVYDSRLISANTSSKLGVHRLTAIDSANHHKPLRQAVDAGTLLDDPIQHLAGGTGRTVDEHESRLLRLDHFLNTVSVIPPFNSCTPDHSKQTEQNKDLHSDNYSCLLFPSRIHPLLRGVSMSANASRFHIPICIERTALSIHTVPLSRGQSHSSQTTPLQGLVHPLPLTIAKRKPLAVN